MKTKIRSNRRFFDRPTSGLARTAILLFALLLVAFIGISDYKTDDYFSVYVFYSVPIFIAAWYTGRWAGVLTCIATSSAWAIVDYKLIGPLHVFHYVDAVIRFIFFVTVSMITSFLNEAYRREQSLAATDYLTGLPNKRAFIVKASSEIERSKRYNRPFTIAYLDLDNFKVVNDQFGHDAGDQILKEFASVLRANIRATDFAARVGGDEFLLLLPETNSANAPPALAHLHNCLSQMSEDSQFPLTLTIGAITYETPIYSAVEMIKQADQVMYSAKNAGKNTVRHICAPNSIGSELV
jgi:diguanylate cyclase (GGDEF)-like protein